MLVQQYEAQIIAGIVAGLNPTQICTEIGKQTQETKKERGDRYFAA